MFNLQPGQGLGSTPSKLIAFGMGSGISELIEEIYKTHLPGGSSGPWDGEEDMRRIVLRDDDEVLGAIITILTSGIL